MYEQARHYDESIERGITYDDPDVGIAWRDALELIPSKQDASAPQLWWSRPSCRSSTEREA